METTKTIIGFEVTKKKKEEIVMAANNYKVNNIRVPLKLSQFVRMAIDNLLNEIRR